ncbi:site-specific integrase [Mesoflavibacter profundi]|uniref:Site-specific integrase n=1 Tax=Mesoflavibacter profundi TaxID=2708110 RepID=A0ABT4RZZ5_9FLAO|nr:tyrosine-type recombinase/integrase [Mesoflavibacter profundi]MDA0177208.1 site-specific integrase [Mesoflavibacter profundi]
MASVNFLYRSTKDKANLNLRLLYRYNSKDFVFGAKTKFEVTKYYWTKQHKKKSKDIEITNQQTETNTELNKIENHILKAFNSVSPDAINKEWLQTQIDNYYNPKTETSIPTNLIDYIDFYIDYRKNELKETSIKKFNVIKSKLERFETYRKKQILIKDINDSFKNEFVNYQKKQMYSQNTMQRELVFIKTFCKHARFLGLETHPQLDELRIDRQKVDKIFLTFEDLNKIENISKDKLTDSLDNAKDWLIISAYTGQRISDFMRFTDEQIRVENGKHLIEFTQKKTDKNMTVPLHSKVIDILNKRNGKFPYKISDQKYNDFIKVVCKLAELNEPTKGSKLVETEPESGIFRKKTGTYKKWELVTSHIGRRSFATNFYGTIPTTYLIYVTGHSTEAMFLNYIGKSNKDLALEMTKYF